MKSTSAAQLETTVAATVAGEDVNCGDFVAVLSVVYEVPSYMWDSCESVLPAQELVRLKMIPSDAGIPLKVQAICLPFIYAKNAAGEFSTLDVRRQQIVRLDRQAAKEVWKSLRSAGKTGTA